MTYRTKKVIKYYGGVFVPKVFSEYDRNTIRANLMRLGLEVLENGGYKAASIEDIARQAGIAKGTFYNFFPSKEHFYFEIMLSIRDKNRNDFHEFISSNNKLDKKKVEDFLFERYAKRKNVYHYFSTDEFNIIFRKIPKQISITNIDSTSFAAGLFAQIPNVNPEINKEVVVNIMNIMGSYAADKGLMSAGSREETISFLANALASYIIEGGE